MIFMVYAISRHIMPQGFAFLAAAFMLSAPAMYYNRFFTFFCVLNLYLLVCCVEKVQPQRYLYLVGAILLSGFFKFEVALFSFLCSVVILATQSFLRTNQKHSLIQEGQVSVIGQTKFWISIGLLVLVLIPALSFLFKKNFFNLAVDMVLGSYQVWGNSFPSVFPFFTLWTELGLSLIHI